MMLAALQSLCPAGADFAGYMRDFEFIKAFTCGYFETAGVLVTGVMVYGAISLALYIRTDSVMIPFVLLLLIGGAVMQQLAGIVVAMATVLLLTVGAGALTYLYYRFSR